MRIKSEKDFFAGLMFMVAGIAFAWGATNYTIGDAARMGPGYFPLILGILLALVGLFVTFEALVVETEDGEKVGKFAWKPLFFIIFSNVVFGICIGGIPKLGIPALGLIVGIYALTFIASLAGEEHKNREVIVLATVLAIISYVAFIYLLKLQFPVWPSFLTR
ncbi:tripartite tricarboxylate transporter TctB family protein [Ramlibacter pallidus]|uniref:Tripartite tricarboxylate transporter TctB family protein n=1 Tax=Ramlibacter pallidus TaxID=2780087 RepID=A0ABR9S8T0_9BURK|nr:tripartite tricarboxylate transporter TctB family protein [Ramlibacter pallidus]MBE7369377.1 tripartite tricarboxylate transporter TctB family protein [Ramlibacter pallidus]